MPLLLSPLVVCALLIGCSSDDSDTNSAPESDAGAETATQADVGGETSSQADGGGPSSFLNCAQYEAISAAEACSKFAAAYCKAYNGCAWNYWSYPTDDECAAAQVKRCTQFLGSDGVEIRPAWFAAMADRLESDRCLSQAWDVGAGFMPELVTDPACGSLTGKRPVGASCAFGVQCSTGACTGGPGPVGIPISNSSIIFSQCGQCQPLTGSAQKGAECEDETDCAQGLTCVTVRYKEATHESWRECVDATRNRALGDECSASVQCIGWPAEAVCIGYRSETDNEELTMGRCTKTAGEGESCATTLCTPGWWCDEVNSVCTKQYSFAAAGEDCSVRECDPMFLECYSSTCVERKLPVVGEPCKDFGECAKGLECRFGTCEEVSSTGGECTMTCAGSAWCLDSTCVEFDPSACD